VHVRWIREGDVAAVLELINGDRLPGQPSCDRRMLRDALQGRSKLERQWWSSFSAIRCLVATENGRVVGAVSFTSAEQGHDGYLLWLHTDETPAVTDTLLKSFEAALPRASRLRAFFIATPLTAGLEGLPRSQRETTHYSLLSHGYAARDAWLFLTGPVPPAAPEPSVPVAVQWRDDDSVHLVVKDGEGRLMGESQLAFYPDGVVVWWWIHVPEEYRGRGLSRQITCQVVNECAKAGAHTMSGYIDHNNAACEDRRGPALALYENLGARIVDNLWEYEKSRS
jgi:ribosomal protein S18 acetylase RimI-like enzyme